MPSSWYEEIPSGSSNLEQGDLVKGCQIIIPPDTVSAGERFRVTVQEYDVVVMSQSCDLAHSKLKFIVVCPFYTLRKFLDTTPSDQKSEKNLPRLLKSLVDGLQPNYYILNRDSAVGIEDYLIINFRDVFTVHIDYIKKHASLSNRNRLSSPYKEQLSQAFGKFFMRVGLPLNIPTINHKDYI